MKVIDSYIERSRPLILHLIAGRVSWADGEDVAQDVSLKVWQYQQREPEQFWALVGRGEDGWWLRTIIGHAIIDHFRHPWISREVTGVKLPQLVSSEPSPEDLVWGQDLIVVYKAWLANINSRSPAKTANAWAIRRTRDKQRLIQEMKNVAGTSSRV